MTFPKSSHPLLQPQHAERRGRQAPKHELGQEGILGEKLEAVVTHHTRPQMSCEYHTQKSQVLGGNRRMVLKGDLRKGVTRKLRCGCQGTDQR